MRRATFNRIYRQMRFTQEHGLPAMTSVKLLREQALRLRRQSKDRSLRQLLLVPTLSVGTIIGRGPWPKTAPCGFSCFWRRYAVCRSPRSCRLIPRSRPDVDHPVTLGDNAHFMLDND